MKIIIAPDFFKESLSSLEVAQQVEAGFKEIIPDAQYHKLPVADGGEGTTEALAAATGGELRTVRVNGPCSLEEALTTAAQNVRRTARHLAAVMHLGNRRKPDYPACSQTLQSEDGTKVYP